MTFETYEHDGNPWVCFHLFGETYKFDFPHFGELVDFSRNCLPESQAMRNFNYLDFCNDISDKTARIRFIDIQNPSLRFLHWWLLSHPVLRPKPDAHHMYAQDQVVIHTVRM
jgi:hypothetical protein